MVGSKFSDFSKKKFGSEIFVIRIKPHRLKLFTIFPQCFNISGYRSTSATSASVTQVEIGLTFDVVVVLTRLCLDLQPTQLQQQSRK